MKTLGQIGYEAYCASAGWKSLVSGAQLPQWVDVKPDIQTAWEAAGEQIRLNTIHAPEPDWPDCKQVQCQQVHNALESVMQCLGITCDPAIYVVGKAVRIAERINALLKCKDLLKEYVNVDVPTDCAPLVGTLPQRAREAMAVLEWPQ